MLGKGLKYISYNGAFCEEIIIFSTISKHSDVANRMLIGTNDILGAGFVVPTDTKLGYKCSGDSVSLRVKSRGDKDTELFGREYN